MRNNTTNTAFRDLTREWNGIVRSPRSARTLAIWAEAEPALADVSSMVELLDHRSNEVLGALLRIGDGLARRAFLQAMLPGLIGVTSMGLAKDWIGPGRAWRHPAELNAQLLELTWAWIDRHAGNPPLWPARTLVAHLVHSISYEAKLDRRHVGHLTAFELVDHDRVGDQSAERAGVLGAMQMVCDAVEAGALPLSYAQLIYSIRIRRDGYQEWSDRTGRSVAALKQVCRRAEAKLVPFAEQAA